MSKCKNIFRNIIICYIFLLVLTNTSITLFAKEIINIDTSKVSKGVVGIKYNGSFDQRLKVIIQKGTEKYTYDITDTYEQFPLQMGNGSYTITSYKNVGGKSYAMINQLKVNVNTPSKECVYLNSIQPVEWAVDNNCIKFARGLTKGISKNYGKITTLYNHMLGGGYVYDINKISRVSSTYSPDIEDTYKSKKGICYDFSSLYGAMLRSLGVPAKLVKGYANGVDGYHAWNEVYDSDKKEWIIIDATCDIEYKKVQIKVQMAKNNSDYQKVKEY